MIALTLPPSTPSFISIADIKRGGMAALDAALRSGPAHIMKRNRSAAVVLSSADYTALIERAALADRAAEAIKPSNLDWLLLQPIKGHTQQAAQVEADIQALRADWASFDARSNE